VVVSVPVAIVLAAGEGRRMQSDLPKVLHEANGRRLVDWVLDAARAAGIARIVVVVGHKADEVRSALSVHEDVSFALQSEQLGTGHAVMMCQESLQEHAGPILVLNGDMPLIRSSSISALLESQLSHGAACVIGTARTEANAGLGRIVRDSRGDFERIVEEVDASPEEALIEEINTGLYVFDGPSLWRALSEVEPNNRQGQYYLTDCAAILRDSGETVVASCSLDITEAMGVNTPDQLEDVSRALSGA
tara:strand:+ start:347 stop:1090 length:744 start_codon:yes stop_codon:yes gene_type:complete